MHPGADGKSRAMVDFGRGYVVDIYPTELSPIRIVASEIPAPQSFVPPRPSPFAADIAAADSVEGQLRSEGQRWEPASGPIQAGMYVQDILVGRLNQPEGRGVIGKVVSKDDYIGMEHSWVDFGRGCVEHIRDSELRPIRFVASDRAAPDSFEWQFRSEGQCWQQIAGPIQVGMYVQDLLQGRPNVPQGKGIILSTYASQFCPICVVLPETPARFPAVIRPGPARSGRPSLVVPDDAAPDSMERHFSGQAGLLTPADGAAPDSMEGQFWSGGQRWERTSGQIQVGIYVEDILPGRLNQPPGRGMIGKVVSMYVNENGRDCARVDFGRGYIMPADVAELSPVRILWSGWRTTGIAPAVHAAGPPSVQLESVPDSSNPTDGFYLKTVDPQSGQYAIVNSMRDTVIMKDSADRVIWSTNVMAAWKAFHPKLAGAFLIHSMVAMKNGDLEVGITGGTARVDKQTGETWFQSSQILLDDTGHLFLT
jgi:hypothetical protein